MIADDVKVDRFDGKAGFGDEKGVVEKILLRCGKEVERLGE